MATQKHFFHWFLEFPEVFAEGGFNCILGNPPFLGGQKLSGTFGDRYLEYMRTTYAPAGSVDLVTYFFRRIFEIIKDGAFQSLIATNTIAQGGAREGGLDVLVSRGGSINHAVKSMRWPGLAAVEVALVTVRKGEWKGTCILNNNPVKTITPYLDDSEITGNPYPLITNETKSFQGSIVLGKGFILTPEEAMQLIERDPRNRDVLFPYLNGEDLNSRPDQSPSRWVINFFDWPEARARQYHDCYEIVERLVKPDRQRWAKDKHGTNIVGEYALRKPLPEKWWIYAEKRPALYRSIAPMERALVIAQVSKTSAFSFTDTNKVLDAKLNIFALNKNYQFSFLQSNLHIQWAWRYSSTMKTDLSYAPSMVFETFPFPQSMSQDAEIELNKIGELYHEHRRQLMLSLQLGHKKDLSIADVEKASKHLNRVCKNAYQDILKLRELHVEMDNAVLSAYGWIDLNLAHDFYEVDYLPENDRMRFTISPDARREILKRLLKLNHEIHEQEDKAGLLKKKKPIKKDNNISDAVKGAGLFDAVELENDQHKQREFGRPNITPLSNKFMSETVLSAPDILTDQRSYKVGLKVPTDHQTWMRLSKWVKDEMKVYTGWADFALIISNKLKSGANISDKERADMNKCWQQAIKSDFR
ncbi:MAG: Eco57I restriction-modification methylase domain-containing protein [Dissulfurispiraceae bacterium]